MITCLKNFSVDTKRHSLVVETEFYQMSLIKILETVRKNDPDLFKEGGIFLPSWSKFVADPVKGKGFFVHTLQAMFEGKHNSDEINIDLQTRRDIVKENHKVEMAFLSGSTKNDNMLIIEKIAQQALDGWAIKSISGASGMTNASSEIEVKEFIKAAKREGKNVLLLSAGMAQRSFSVGEITSIYLMYDSGDNGATIQKMSRALTPHDEGKIGRIFSLSFDPNRDDKFDSIILETAQNLKKNKNISDIKDAVRIVLKTVDIYQCSEDGRIKIEVDHYLEEALARKSIDRIIGKLADFSGLSDNELKAIASGNSEVYATAKQENADKGKTYKDEQNTKNSSKKIKDSKEELIEKARKVIITIAENIDVIRFQCSSLDIEEAFNKIDNYSKSEHARIKELFGLDYNLIKELVLNGVINKDLLDLKF